jgi:uncharacterized protein YggE
LITFFATGCLESADANSEQKTEDFWRLDSIELMQHETEGYYGCFGCSTPGEGPAMCIDPILEMKKVDETEERYCNSNFEVIDLHLDTLASEITSFEECIAAGYPAMESHPRQCRTSDGQTFVEILDGQKSSSSMEMAVPVPRIEGSDVVETIAIEYSDFSEPSIEVGLARAEILPPVPPVGSVSPVGRGIHVSGQGKVAAVPDIVLFAEGVVTTGETAQDASQKNALAMDRVLKSLKNLGIEDADIKTQTVSVWPEYDYGHRDEGRRELPIIIGYRAENRVSVTIRDISMAGEAIDAAVEAGSNQVYGLSYSFSENRKDQLYAVALKEAVADGTSKASAIADAIGAEKITPVSVYESGGFYPPIYRMDMAEAALEKDEGVPTPVSPGELEVYASVSMSFDFV